MSKKIIKKVLITSWIIIATRLNVFAADPSFYINPTSWTNLKLYCKYIFNIKLNAWWQNYNGFYSTIKFNSWEINISHSSIDSFFTNTASGIKDWYIYKTQWAAMTWSIIDRNLSNFIFNSKSNITWTILTFTNCDWWTPTFGTWTTDDCAVLNWYLLWWYDILAWLDSSSYTFSALPCIPDVNSPIITNINIAGWASKIPSNQIISMLLNDRTNSPNSNVPWPLPLENNKRSHYRYSWWATILSNYVQAPITVDNQEWVNSWSIKVTVTAPNYPSYWTYVLSWSSLNISDFEWNSTINKFTWNSNIRWYNIFFNPPNPYPIEKQINVSIIVSDRPNEFWEIHTGTSSFSFNAPIAPTINMLAPYPTTFVNPRINEIKFYISDDWAGINTWSIKLTIPEIYSWSELMMSWHTYSWNELTFILSWWSEWLWNSWKYIVSFVPKRDFPNNKWIIITWIFNDLAWTTWFANFSFQTRPDCWYFWCSTILWIDIDWIVSYFDWEILIITWTNPDWPYPYLTWIDNNIMMCWPINFTWTTLTWNIQLENNNWISVLWTFYTWANLYITGLDIMLSWNTIFIQ